MRMSELLIITKPIQGWCFHQMTVTHLLYITMSPEGKCFILTRDRLFLLNCASTNAYSNAHPNAYSSKNCNKGFLSFAPLEDPLKQQKKWLKLDGARGLFKHSELHSQSALVFGKLVLVAVIGLDPH